MYKPKLQNSIKLSKIILISVCTVIIALSIFTLGIYTANTEWFNDTFYIKSRQMQNLNIKSLKPYDNALFKSAVSQIDMNIASKNRYEHYHKHYEKVIDRIFNLELDDAEKITLFAYIDGYDERKLVMEYVLFPKKDTEGEYGTMYNSTYYTAMLEFDRQELLTYRMILKNMYASYTILDIDKIFEE